MNRRPTAALLGVGVFILGIAGAIAAPELPDFVGESAEILSYYEEESAVLTANVLYLLSGVVFLFFASYLRSVSRVAEGGTGWISNAGFAGAIAGYAVAFASAAIDMTGALRFSERDTISPEVATALFDLSMVLYGLAMPMAIAVLVLATAIVALRTGFLPAWLGGVSVVLGIALLIPPINYIAIIVFNFWVLAVALTLYFRPPVIAAATPPANTAV